MQAGALFNNVIFSASEARTRKEEILKQHAKVIWMSGLSGAGKSTLATILDNELTLRGYVCRVIDGDEIRAGLNKGLGFSTEDRHENLRRVAEVAKLFAGSGIVTIVSFITPTGSIRNTINEILGDDYFEVFVDAPLEVCEKRDVKGLYKQVREGKIKNFTGIDSPFEPPLTPAIRIDTNTLNVEQSSCMLLDFVLPLIEYTK
jgi:adenylylsulfate kinase